MKKIALALLAFTVLASLMSCKKDYTCECTSGGTTTKFTIKNATKRQAKANCYSSSISFGSIVSKTDCSLK